MKYISIKKSSLRFPNKTTVWEQFLTALSLGNKIFQHHNSMVIMLAKSKAGLFNVGFKELKGQSTE
jgi:hypothetical protein